MKVYLIPGLGYTHRLFEKLTFKSPKIEHLDWIEPKANEAISDYAARLSEGVQTQGESLCMIGHSFGGIIAQEIAKHKKIDSIVLISSIRSRNELPFFFKMANPLALHKLFSRNLAIKTVRYWGVNHGFETKEEQSLFREMVASHSDNYLQWALKTLSSWKGIQVPKSTRIYQIHGNRDKTFPLKLLNNPDKIVEKGSHIMVYKQAPLVEEILRSCLNLDF
ncbi:MAG: alpha/beta hydrolase [Bacteroidia bacterium]|nr:alpha/beta hydrolase [Bacteroidia bacterium]